MVKKYYFYHKKSLNKVYFSKVHNPFFIILKVTQTSSVYIFYDAIY